jgi:hypothetical protein
MAVMKTAAHFLGDRVSVRCRRSFGRDRDPASSDQDVSWLGGTIIARDAVAARGSGACTRYVVQLDDQRRVVAFDDDVRRFTLAFEIYETLEKMAS